MKIDTTKIRTSNQVAKILGITTNTLYVYMQNGTVSTPEKADIGGMRFTIWSYAELKRAFNTLKRLGKLGGQKKRPVVLPDPPK